MKKMLLLLGALIVLSSFVYSSSEYSPNEECSYWSENPRCINYSHIATGLSVCMYCKTSFTQEFWFNENEEKLHFNQKHIETDYIYCDEKLIAKLNVHYQSNALEFWSNGFLQTWIEKNILTSPIIEKNCNGVAIDWATYITKYLKGEIQFIK